MFRKAFPWSRDENKELPLVDEKGDKVRIREKREGDIRNEYSWRVDPELSRLDATRPMTMSYRQTAVDKADRKKIEQTVANLVQASTLDSLQQARELMVKNPGPSIPGPLMHKIAIRSEQLDPPSWFFFSV